MSSKLSAGTANPEPADVIKLREQLQQREALGITAAQDRCAELLHTSRRAWQQWEHGDRKMHPAFWELATSKVRRGRPQTYVEHDTLNPAVHGKYGIRRFCAANHLKTYEDIAGYLTEVLANRDIKGLLKAIENVASACEIKDIKEINMVDDPESWLHEGESFLHGYERFRAEADALDRVSAHAQAQLELMESELHNDIHKHREEADSKARTLQDIAKEIGEYPGQTDNERDEEELRRLEEENDELNAEEEANDPYLQG